MKAGVRLIWLFTLVAFVSGCATYKSASLPGQYVATATEQGPALVVQEGAMAKVTLSSGEIITGEVVAVSDRELVVESFENYGIERHTIAAADIQKIEIEALEHDDKRIGKSIVIIGAVILVGLAVFAYSLRGLGD